MGMSCTLSLYARSVTISGVYNIAVTVKSLEISLSSEGVTKRFNPLTNGTIKRLSAIEQRMGYKENDVLLLSLSLA